MDQTINSTPLSVDGSDKKVSSSAENLFRNIVSSVTSFAIITVDLNGEVTSWNKGARELFGYSSEEVISNSLSIVFQPQDISTDRLKTTFELPRLNNRYHFNHWLKHKNGSRLWLDIYQDSIFDENDQLLGYSMMMNKADHLASDEGLLTSAEKIRTANDILLNNDLRLRKLIENSFSGITLLDKDFKIIYRSPSAERINGWSNTDRNKFAVDEVVHPSYRGKVANLLHEVVLEPGVTKTCTFQSKHFDGHYIWLECTYTNMLNIPDIEAIVCNFIEITEKKRTESFLNTTVNELSAYKYALDESSIVAITDQKGTIQHVNENFCKISKYSEAELIGQDHRIINSGYHDKQFIKNLWATIANGRTWKGELKNKAKDGSFYWVDTAIIPFLDERGKPYQYIAIRSDITERKLNEQKVIESELFIKTITDNLPAMIAYWSADLHCLFANKAYLDWFEMQSNTMIGIHKRALMDEKEFEHFGHYIERVLEGLPQSFERTFYKKNGQTIYTHTQYVPDIHNGVVKGFYSLIYDYTEVMFAETELKKKTAQIADLLENITDGFIALDENRCYTYANQRIGKMLGIEAELMIGKNIWELFPDAVGSDTYRAIEAAYINKEYACNVDYYAPLKLWQENRIYPSGDGLSIFIRDISQQKMEEHHLKLLESVITNTSDAILITEAEPFDEPGPRILYVNEAFTEMTGYSSEDLIGKTPRIFQGPKTDKEELKRLSASIRNWQPCEFTIINYRKNGEEFWVNFALTPVADEKGWFTHWISTDRDVTQRKNEELLRTLTAEMSLIFNQNINLNNTLEKVLERLVDFGSFTIAEAWLIGVDKNKINLSAKCPPTDNMLSFYEDSAHVKSFRKGEGLPGTTWETGITQFWQSLDENVAFIRKDAAKKVGLKSAYGLPLIYNSEIVGVLVLGLNNNIRPGAELNKLLNNFSYHISAEIKRKQLEQELNQIFLFAPDIICITGTDGYYKKVNPAMSRLMEYSETEIMAWPIIHFVHPEDILRTTKEFESLTSGEPTLYFENRIITKSGRIKWLAWTATPSPEEGLLFCVAKDITDKKELEELFNKSSALARIGSWEINLIKGTVFWSGMTKEIHGVSSDFEPDNESAASFCKAGLNRELIIQKVTETIEKNIPFDVEIQIVTAQGKDKWVRINGEAEYNDNNCLRVYGSFQDIDDRKKAEILATSALEERNTILESIDDAFFAVDKNWVVTYWNKMAETVLMKPKNDILNYRLWDVFINSIDSDSYKKYHEAMQTGQAVHFEDFYPPLDKWYEISAYPSDNGLSVYFKDITDRKNAESRLKALNENLQKHAKELAISNAELEQFAYVASHDLQEPLRMVTSFLTLIDKKYSDYIDQKGKQYIHFAVDGAKRMRQIILDLLEFSRVGRLEDNLEEVDLNKLVNDILILYRKQIEEQKAKVLVSELPVLQTLKVPIRQVFQNLISNSLKYQKAGDVPLIEISAEDQSDHWQFSVKDNGIGIDEEYFDKVFIIFQRLHNKDEYSGTGMGLAVTKKIIENLGGRIWITSEKNSGSTFYFTILKPIKA